MALEWVDISKRKPRNRQKCLVLVGGDRVYLALADRDWAGGFRHLSMGMCIRDVTHWMPYEAPKEGGTS